MWIDLQMLKLYSEKINLCIFILFSLWCIHKESLLVNMFHNQSTRNPCEPPWLSCRATVRTCNLFMYIILSHTRPVIPSYIIAIVSPIGIQWPLIRQYRSSWVYVEMHRGCSISEHVWCITGHEGVLWELIAGLSPCSPDAYQSVSVGSTE